MLHDPWSYIGYWGDHQIIYLLKLLEILDRHEPADIARLSSRAKFSPTPMSPTASSPTTSFWQTRRTPSFSTTPEKLVHQRVRAEGADGKFVWDEQGQVRLVNMTEKLLVPLLAKLSNFIPDAGIWLNTQRPEWNDANNALVGNGASDGHAVLPAPTPDVLP